MVLEYDCFDDTFLLLILLRLYRIVSMLQFLSENMYEKHPTSLSVLRLRRQGLFQQSMRRKGVHENDLFDWEKASSEVSVTNSGATTNIAVIESKKPGYVRRLLIPLTPFTQPVIPCYRIIPRKFC